MIRVETAGLVNEFASVFEFADYLYTMAKKEMADSMVAPTIKEQRYHQGKSVAFSTVAEMLGKK